MNHIFYTLGQLFEEKRLAFNILGVPTGAPAGAPVSAPQAAPASAPVIAPETPEEMKNRVAKEATEMKDKVAKKATEMKDKMKAATGNPDKYTQGLVDVTKEIEASITEIETKLNLLDISTLPKEDAKKALTEFNEGLTKIETEGEENVRRAFGGKNFSEALTENETAKTLITEQRTILETRRAELNAYTIINEIIEGMQIQDEAIKVALKEKALGKGEAQKEMDDFLEDVKTKLDDADKSSLTEQDAKDNIEPAKALLDDAARTKDGFKGQFGKSLFEPYKPILTAYDRGRVLGSKSKNRDNCKLAMAAFGVAVGELIKAENSPDEETVKKLEEKHTELILMGYVADVIEETPEKIKAALLFYDLGKYESEVDSEENKNAKEVIDKIIANKEVLKTAGVAIDFLGGTDGTAHGIHKEKEWHEAKVAALQKLVEFSKVDGIIIPPLTLTPEQEALITAYETAVEAGTAVNFVKEHKTDFLDGGKLFDMALALQRAEDMKKKINNDQSVELDATDSISLELGTTQDTRTERKSSLKFRAVEPVAAAPAPDPNAPAPDPNAAPAPTVPNTATPDPALADPEPDKNEEKTLPDGSIAKGIFDEKDPSKLLAGTRTYPDSTVEGGIFDKETGNLIQGTRTSKDGEVLEGEFDGDTGMYIVETQTYDVKDGKIILETTKSNGTTDTEEYAIDAPAGAIFEQLNGGEFIGVELDGKNAAVNVSADGNDIEITDGDLLYDYDLSFDGTTVKLEKRENPEYEYKLTPDGKTLTLNRTKGGVPEILTYIIENPDDLKLKLRYDSGDADVVVSTTDDSKSAYFEILPDGSFVSQNSNVALSDVLTNDYDITLDGTTIKILKKAAPAATPPAPIEKILPDNSLAIGTFDKETSRLIDGKITSPNGRVAEGKFDKETGWLIDGKITSPNGTVEEGKFDKETGWLIDGKITSPNGKVIEGKFDKDTGWLIDGKITYPDGKVTEGKFDKDTGRLIDGKRTYPGGQVAEGKFDATTGKPLVGNKTTRTDGKVYIYNGTNWIEQ
jgi:hypothetical protein